MAIDHLVRTEFGGRCFLGPRLKTSSSNEISKEKQVTPDVLVEINNSSKRTYQGVIEIKTDLPKDTEYWKDIIRQLKKYDDVLKHNPARIVKGHDLFFTTNVLRTTPFKTYLDTKPLKSEISDIKNLVIMHSNIMERSEQFLVLKAEYGTISEPDLHEVLSNGVGIKLLGTLSDINQVKFVDSEPPVLYTMQVIWDHVFKLFVTLDQNRELNKNKNVLITVGLGEIREILKRFCHDSSPDCIDINWVKKAMDGFSELGISEPSMIKERYFDVKIRKFKGKTVDYFLKKLVELNDNDKNRTLDSY